MTVWGDLQSKAWEAGLGGGVRGGEAGGVTRKLRGSCQILEALEEEGRMSHRMEGVGLGGLNPGHP